MVANPAGHGLVAHSHLGGDGLDGDVDLLVMEGCNGLVALTQDVLVALPLCATWGGLALPLLFEVDDAVPPLWLQ